MVYLSHHATPLKDPTCHYRIRHTLLYVFLHATRLHGVAVTPDYPCQVMITAWLICQAIFLSSIACITCNVVNLCLLFFLFASISFNFHYRDYITPILQHDPVSRIRYVSAYPYPIHFCAFNFCRNLMYPRIRILPIPIRVSVSVLHS